MKQAYLLELAPTVQNILALDKTASISTIIDSESVVPTSIGSIHHDYPQRPNPNLHDSP